MTDGSLYFKVKLDDKDAEKSLESLQKKIADTQTKIKEYEDMMIKAGERAEQAYGRGDKKEGDYWAKQSDKYSKMMEQEKDKLESMKNQATDLNKQISATSKGSASKLADAFGSVSEKFESFVNRVKALSKRVLIFSTITMALRAIRNLLGQIVAKDEETREQMAQLKGALMTLIQPLINFLLPVLQKAVQFATQIVLAISNVVAQIAGTSLSKLAKQAQSIAESTEETSQNLASFDTIQSLDNTNSSIISPSFNFQNIASPILEIINLIKDVLTPLIQGIAGVFKNTWKVVKGLLIGAYDETLGGFEGIVSNLWGILLSLVSGFSRLIDELGTKIVEALGLTDTRLGQFILGAVDVITGFLDLVFALFNGNNEDIVKSLQKILEGFHGMIKGALGWVGEFIGNIGNLVASLLESIVTKFGFTNEYIVNAINLLAGIIRGVTTVIKGILTGDMESIKEGLITIGKTLVNTLIFLIEKMLNKGISAINGFIDGVNRIIGSDFISNIFGKTLAIPKIPTVSIPRLATGGVIPPNREFLSVLGDNKTETEVVSPLSTMKEALLEALRESGLGNQEIVLNIDGRAFARTTQKYFDANRKASGV